MTLLGKGYLISCLNKPCNRVHPIAAESILSLTIGQTVKSQVSHIAVQHYNCIDKAHDMHYNINITNNLRKWVRYNGTDQLNDKN